jgi:hypothetical protein
MNLIFDETIKELWEIIDLPKYSSKEKTKSIGLILNISKERQSVLEKRIGMLRSKNMRIFLKKTHFSCSKNCF